MMGNYKYVALDSSYFYKSYLNYINPFLDQISPNIVSLIYTQILRLTFDKLNINISELQRAPSCENIVMSYGLIINNNIKNNLCDTIEKYYYSILTELLNELSKHGLLDNGCLHWHIFVEHDQTNNLILLKRVNN